MRRAVCVLAMLLFAGAAFAQGTAGQQKSATAKGSTDVASVRKAIAAANAAFLSALQKGDATAATANYANDAIVMMPGEPAWKGHAAILKGLQAFLNGMTVKDGATHTEDVMVNGNMAVETGTFEWTLGPKTGAAVKDKGKYLTVWKRQPDGTWKILRDINNSDLPAK